MAVNVAQPDRIIVRSNATLLSDDRRSQTLVRAAIGAIVRSLLIGLGVGVTLSLGRPGGVIGIATVGVLAIGAALASWDT